MELTLTHLTPGEVRVACDQQESHTFLLWTIPHPEEMFSFTDPLTYGRKLYQALFPLHTEARHRLGQQPERIMLVAEEDDLDAFPWEYLYGFVDEEEVGAETFLATVFPFVRGLPEEQRVKPSTEEHSLRIVAVPSHPLSEKVPQLDIEDEWKRLKETIASLTFALTLENLCPPTLMRLHEKVAEQRHCVVHFMGHGEQRENGAVLYFEHENGDLDEIQAQQLVQCLQGVFLVTLNACVTAASGMTAFSNLAAALVRQQIPYALGMRFHIKDSDARIFSQAFYAHLARGAPIEMALCQARRILYETHLAEEKTVQLGSIGVPVLYTSLTTPLSGFVCQEGKPTLKEFRQPEVELSALPSIEGGLQGRIEDLKYLGTHLTGENRPPLLTIHGGGGQGKTALARRAIERFAFAWPGGIWAYSLEPLPDYATIVVDLARFLGISTQNMADSSEIERQILAHLAGSHLLIVLDNAEALVYALEAKDASALQLAQLLQQMISQSAHLLVTSRTLLEWDGEVVYELGGLKPEEGVALLRQHAPQRAHEIDQATAMTLSAYVEGHPLSLCLLAGIFNSSQRTLSVLLEEYKEQLAKVENTTQDARHRHRSLVNCVEISVRSLDNELRNLLRNLCIFRAPFLPEIAVAIFDPDRQETESQPSSVRAHLDSLWRRGLLEHRSIAIHDERASLYVLSPAIRLLVEQFLEPVEVSEQEELMMRLGRTFARFVTQLSQEINSSAIAVVLAQQCAEDLERGETLITGPARGEYLSRWAGIVLRLGNLRRSLLLLEQALEIFQTEGDRYWEATILHNLAAVSYGGGEWEQALLLYEESLLIKRELGDHSGKVATLNAMATIHNSMGQPKQALELYEQVLPLRKEPGDRNGEAITLNGMAEVYRGNGNLELALPLYEQALPLMREVRNRVGEAIVLNNMALVYNAMGKQEQALLFLEAALPISRELRDRAGEATSLNNLAELYHDLGNIEQALLLFEEALPIKRELRDRAGEAIVLHNMARMYGSIGDHQRALELYEQALLITREIGDIAGEASALNGRAMIYSDIGQVEQALSLYEQALLLIRKRKDQDQEILTLSNMAVVYYDTGQTQRAMDIYEQALSVTRERGNRKKEATILNNMAGIYNNKGKPEQALSLYEQVLPIKKELGDRAGEAAVLNNLALTYGGRGQLELALSSYEQALLIMREIRDHAGEARTLNNMALVYNSRGKPEQALALYEQAIPITREVGDRSGEATTLYHIAEIYYGRRQPEQALALYEQALLIMREIKGRQGEATILNNMAVVYQNMGQRQRALSLYKEALPIRREIGDRHGEAATLNGLAHLSLDMQHYNEARHNFEASLAIEQETSHPAGEAAARFGLGNLLYHYLNRPSEAIAHLEEAITLLKMSGLPQDAAGQTTEEIHQVLMSMKQGTLPEKRVISVLADEMVQQIIWNTVAVMTIAPEQRSVWRDRILATRQEVQQQGSDWQIEVDFCNALLNLLRGDIPALPTNHPYAEAILVIERNIAIQQKETGGTA